LKYLFLSLILLLTSCSLSKDSAYSNDDLKKSDEDKRLSKILKKTGDYKSMTFDEFNLFLKDYLNNTEYPDINQ
jgi:hypothetical protein